MNASAYDQAKLGPMIERRLAEVAREAAAKAEAEEQRQEANRRSREDGIRKEDERRRQVRAAIDERRSAARAVAVAEVRANVERDLRRNGVAEAEIAKHADAAMGRYHEDRALEAATMGDRRQRALEAYFRSRPAPVFHEHEEAE